jgi:hypothetical protein
MRGRDAPLADVLEASAERAYGDAGPPNSALLAAVGIGLAAAVALWTVAPTVDGWVFLGLGVGGMTAAVALMDRDGWHARQGMAYLATQQLTRWPERPSSASEARDWLADTAHDSAPPLKRAFVQTHAGDLEAARATLASYQPESEMDHVRKLATAMVLDGRSSGSIDIAGIRSESAGLPVEEARYQIASAAWIQACLDIENGRPWRRRYATEIARLGPLELPPGVRVAIILRQLAAPITALISSVLAAAVS